MPHDDSAFAGTAISKPPPCSCYLHGGLCFTCGACKPPSTKTRQREERREVRRSSSCLTSLSAFVCESGVSPCKPSWLLHKHTIIWKKKTRRSLCLQALRMPADTEKLAIKGKNQAACPVCSASYSLHFSSASSFSSSAGPYFRISCAVRSPHRSKAARSAES